MSGPTVSRSVVKSVEGRESHTFLIVAPPEKIERYIARRSTTWENQNLSFLNKIMRKQKNN